MHDHLRLHAVVYHITLHCTALHCVASHCIVLPCISCRRVCMYLSICSFICLVVRRTRCFWIVHWLFMSAGLIWSYVQQVCTCPGSQQGNSIRVPGEALGATTPGDAGATPSDPSQDLESRSSRAKKAERVGVLLGDLELILPNLVTCAVLIDISSVGELQAAATSATQASATTPTTVGAV